MPRFPMVLFASCILESPHKHIQKASPNPRCNALPMQLQKLPVSSGPTAAPGSLTVDFTCLVGSGSNNSRFDGVQIRHKEGNTQHLLVTLIQCPGFAGEWGTNIMPDM